MPDPAWRPRLGLQAVGKPRAALTVEARNCGGTGRNCLEAAASLFRLQRASGRALMVAPWGSNLNNDENQ